VDREDPRPLTGSAAGRTTRGITPLRATALFTLLTVVLTWPQAARLASIPDYRDAYFSIWRMAWIAHQLPRDPWHLFDANIFHPLRHTLAFSDAVLLPALLGAPLAWLGVPSVVVYNLAVFGSFVLCGLGMFLLVRSLTGSAESAIVAGIVFAFAPYRFDHYYHLELLWAQWMPLCLWMLHRAVGSGRVSDGALAGLFFALQGLSCIYYAVFFATVLAVAVPLMLFAERGRAWRGALGAIAAGAGVAAAILVPYLLPYYAASGVVGNRTWGDLTLYSVGPRHYFAAMPASVLYGRLTGWIGAPEKRQFVGLAAVALATLALWPPFDRRRLPYIGALAIAVDASFGHRGLIYPWLREYVPLYWGLRVPARFGHLVLLAVAVLAGHGTTRLAGLFRSSRRPAWWLPATLCLVVVAEYVVHPLTLTPVQTRPGEAYAWLARQPRGVVAEFPFPAAMGEVDREAVMEFRSTFHWMPLVNGYSGFYPDSSLPLQSALAAFPSPDSIEELRRRDVVYLVVHEADYGPERYRRVISGLDVRDVELAGRFREPGGEVTIYRLQMSVRARIAKRILAGEATP
jgi:hypothetical protein